MHLLVENTRRCCAAVARGEVNLAIVGGDIPRELEHLIQVCSVESIIVLIDCVDGALAVVSGSSESPALIAMLQRGHSANLASCINADEHLLPGLSCWCAC